MARPVDHECRVDFRINPKLLARLDQWRGKAGLKRGPTIRLAIERLVRRQPGHVLGKAKVASTARAVTQPASKPRN